MILPTSPKSGVSSYRQAHQRPGFGGLANDIEVGNPLGYEGQQESCAATFPARMASESLATASKVCEGRRVELIAKVDLVARKEGRL